MTELSPEARDETHVFTVDDLARAAQRLRVAFPDVAERLLMRGFRTMPRPVWHDDALPEEAPW